MAVIVKGVTAKVGRGRSSATPLLGIELTVNSGETVAVCGVSGSGKTTLLKLLAGEIQPMSGFVTINGDSPVRSRASGSVASIYQDYRLVPFLTAQENVMLAQEIRGAQSEESEKASLELLSRVGLAGYAERFPHELSGGEQQRVGIARALAVRPHLILADEPTAALDADTAVEIMNVLRSQVLETGACLVVATHDPLVASAATCRYNLTGGVLTKAA